MTGCLASLQPAGYVIETKSTVNTATICEENLNELWTSQPDCLLYRADGFCRDYMSSRE